MLILFSTLINATVDIINTTMSTSIIGESNPNVALCVITTLMLNIMTTKRINPKKSNLLATLPLDFVSGVPLISNIEINAMIIDSINIQRQPINVDTIPPNNDANPEPPQDPIDQKLSAR